MEKIIYYCKIIITLLIIEFLPILSINGQEETLQEVRSNSEARKQGIVPVTGKNEMKCGNGCLITKRTSSEGGIISAAQSKAIGVLVLAHGMHTHEQGEHVSQAVPAWNASVLEAVKPLKQKYPLEVAFGMADPETIKEAVHTLEEKGVSDAIVIPLFISSHSPIIGNSRYILGLQEKLPDTTDVKSLPRVESKVRFRMTEALDDSILVAEILLERANELSTDPTTKETVILVGHGPNDEKENRLWLNDMEKLAWYVREKGGFKEAEVATWRSDAPKEIRDKAIQELRTMVQTSGKEGAVIVVPHLLSSGGVEEEIVDALKGLSYVFNGKTLLPHSNITRWLEKQVEGELVKIKER